MGSKEERVKSTTGIGSGLKLTLSVIVSSHLKLERWSKRSGGRQLSSRAGHQESQRYEKVSSCTDEGQVDTQRDNQ